MAGHKTTRIVRKIIEEAAEQRQAKNDRLRNARLEREAHTPIKPNERKIQFVKAAVLQQPMSPSVSVNPPMQPDTT